MVHKIYLKMHPVLCTNRDVTDLVNNGMVKYTKAWISWERNGTFLPNKKNLNLCFIWHILRSYPFVAEVTFNSMFLYVRERVSEWIHTLYFPKRQGTPCTKQASYLKFKWLRWDLNTQPLSLYTNTQPFSQTG